MSYGQKSASLLIHKRCGLAQNSPGIAFEFGKTKLRCSDHQPLTCTCRSIVKCMQFAFFLSMQALSLSQGRLFPYQSPEYPSFQLAHYEYVSECARYIRVTAASYGREQILCAFSEACTFCRMYLSSASECLNYC